jgi:hypothetical protein
MGELCHDPRLAHEPLGERAARAGQLGAHDLECDRAIELGVVRLVDVAHAPGAEQRAELVAAELAADRRPRCVGADRRVERRRPQCDRRWRDRDAPANRRDHDLAARRAIVEVRGDARDLGFFECVVHECAEHVVGRARTQHPVVVIQSGRAANSELPVRTADQN